MRKLLSFLFIYSFVIPFTLYTSLASDHDDLRQEIDVNYLQTCLKEEGSTLDVLVLMDSSRSLREGESGEDWVNKSGASDPNKLRGPILNSSLKLLRNLAEDSGRKLNVNLKNFGKNSDSKFLKDLQANWLPWTEVNSDDVISNLVQRALYDDSQGTEWANGLKTARESFNQRFSDPKLEGKKSCPIMFWITDGAPDNPSAEKAKICQRSNDASIEWFRERNILVLGGLLKPPNEDASSFAPIVTGKNCGANEIGWTRGSVIEADDVSALAWGFVGLIAKIKNLMNLGAENGSVVIDPGTRVLEIFIKGNPSDWKIKAPDGSTFCSKSQLGSKCEVDEGRDIGIVTVRISSEDTSLPSGRWVIEGANIQNNSAKVYGGVSGELFVSDDGKSIEEDQEVSYKVQLQNPDGTAFDVSGYNSIEICGTVASTKQVECKSGSSLATITLVPGTIDKSISFEAVLVSSQDSERRYRFFQTVKVNVQESKKYPSLVCSSAASNLSCALDNLANKNKTGESILKVEEAKLATSGGKIYLIDYAITSDQIAERGNDKFLFRAVDFEGKEINWNDKSRLLSPGENIKLLVSTDIGGTSKIKGNIKYAVVQDGQEVVRQIDFEFGVESDRNWPVLIALILLAYILTVGIPYLYLLWTAKRAAFLTVPDDQIAYNISPIRITSDGRIVSVTETGTESKLVAPNKKSLTKLEIESGIRSVQVGPALIEVIPPKWNPFKEPVTKVRIPGHHVLSTYGEKSLKADEATFSSSLANEGVIYFSSSENLSPVVQTQIETNKESNQIAVFESSYEERIKEELVKKVGEVSAQVLTIIPFLCNYNKVLQEVTSKIVNSSEAANLRQNLEELRQNQLELALAERELAEKAAQSLAASESENKDKESPKEGGKSSPESQIFDKGMDPNPFLDNNDRGPKIWDNNEEDNPNQGKNGPSIWG